MTQRLCWFLAWVAIVLLPAVAAAQAPKTAWGDPDEFTIDDPVTYTKTWIAQTPWVKTDGRIFEYACHEGNYALTDVLSGARAAERGPKQ